MAKKINKSQLTKIDGMKSLLKILGEDNFIKAVIENTYFFSPRLVHSRFEELSKLIFDGNDIPARKSTQDELYRIEDEKRFFVDKGFECPVKLDKDGNAEVRRIINAKTGYTISQGKKSIFQNYFISHIWGRAYDPRYFTSLWNLAIVPAWAHSLMDKMADEESDELEHLAAKLKSTVETVCWNLYEMEKLCWSNLKMEKPQRISSVNVDSQTFLVHVFSGDLCITEMNLTI